MKQVKKFLCVVLMVCMIVAGITIVPQNVQAATASGDDGEIHWEIKGDTLTLSAVKGTKGRMSKFTKTVTEIDEGNGQSYQVERVYRDPAWLITPTATKVKNIIIENGVTEVQPYTICSFNVGFSKEPQFDAIDTLTIAGSVKTLPSDFAFATKINTIIFCDGVKSVGEMAFNYTKTKKVIVAKSVDNIHWDNFACSLGVDGLYAYDIKFYSNNSKGLKNYVNTWNTISDYCFTDDNFDQWYYKDPLNLGVEEEIILGCWDTSAQGSSRQCNFKINDLSKASILSKAKATSSLSVKKGKTQTIKITLPTGFTKVSKYTGNPADVKVTYKSNNSKVAIVSSSGKVTGKKKGTAKITITMQIKDGAKKTVTTKVTVK